MVIKLMRVVIRLFIMPGATTINFFSDDNDDNDDDDDVPYGKMLVSKD